MVLLAVCKFRILEVVDFSYSDPICDLGLLKTVCDISCYSIAD